jgi:hypothetical protein
MRRARAIADEIPSGGALHGGPRFADDQRRDVDRRALLHLGAQLGPHERPHAREVRGELVVVIDLDVLFLLRDAHVTVTPRDVAIAEELDPITRVGDHGDRSLHRHLEVRSFVGRPVDHEGRTVRRGACLGGLAQGCGPCDGVRAHDLGGAASGEQGDHHPQEEMERASTLPHGEMLARAEGSEKMVGVAARTTGGTPPHDA